MCLTVEVTDRKQLLHTLCYFKLHSGIVVRTVVQYKSFQVFIGFTHLFLTFTYQEDK